MDPKIFYGIESVTEEKTPTVTTITPTSPNSVSSPSPASSTSKTITISSSDDDNFGGEVQVFMTSKQPKSVRQGSRKRKSPMDEDKELDYIRKITGNIKKIRQNDSTLQEMDKAIQGWSTEYQQELKEILRQYNIMEDQGCVVPNHISTLQEWTRLFGLVLDARPGVFGMRLVVFELALNSKKNLKAVFRVYHDCGIKENSEGKLWPDKEATVFTPFEFAVLIEKSDFFKPDSFEYQFQSSEK